jgi:N-acetylneuraminic acid mutarotase
MRTQKTTHNHGCTFNWILTGLMLSALLSAASRSARGAEIWTEKAPMPTARISLTTSVVDGKIYAIGGYARQGASRLRTVEEYDPATDTWTTKAPMPTARAGHSSSVVDRKIYAIGGGPAGSAFSVVEAYDPATDTWTKKASMPAPKVWHSASVVDGTIYAIGGGLGSWSTVRRTVYAYDPVTDTWTQKADMPTQRSSLSTSVVDGKIYAMGGALSSATFLSTVEEYDPATDTWTIKADIPTPRMTPSTGVVDGKIIAIGGGTTSLAFSAVEVYDPTTDTWTVKADMPETRMFLSPGAAVVNEKIYIIGGSKTSGSGHPGVRTVYEYDPAFILTDFNGNGTVDTSDLLKLIEAWGQDEPELDIGPTPSGDGVVDAADLEVLMSYWGQEIDDPTLKACWKLDETEGDVAYDSAAVNDAIVMGNAQWQSDAGTVDGALQFDGIDDYVATPFKLNPADGEFSVFVWINGGASGQVIGSQENGVNWLMAGEQGVLRTDIADPVRISRRGNTGGSSLISQTIISDGDWHRIGFVWDGMDRILYVDDIEVARDALDSLEQAKGDLNIGVGVDFQAESFWSGLIDDVRIYNRVVIP